MTPRGPKFIHLLREPALGVHSPAKTRKNVVFPEPVGPVIKTFFPSSIERERQSTSKTEWSGVKNVTCINANISHLDLRYLFIIETKTNLREAISQNYRLWLPIFSNGYLLTVNICIRNLNYQRDREFVQKDPPITRKRYYQLD